MGFCSHCEGQRFDRAQVLRTLRRLRRTMRDAQCHAEVDQALAVAVQAIAELEIPHLEDELDYGEVVH